MPESPQEEGPSGLPDEEEGSEDQPLGVPDPDPDGEPRRGDEAMPGIPDEGEPPAAS